MSFTEIEQEAIILNAVWGMIDDMVNYAIFMPMGEEVREITLMPKTSESLRLFNILLGDFLSPLSRRGKRDLPFDLPAPPTNARSSDFTFLFYLRRICEHPKLNANADAISIPLNAFATWLEGKSYVEKVWFPSVEVEVNLTIERKVWLKICADVGKHSFARLETNVAKIVHILAEHNHVIDEGVGYTILPEFWAWFHTHLFAYHANTIAEFLNNIRWGIYTYLQSEFARSFHLVEPAPMYRYHIPEGITQALSHSMYWEVMNRCRSKPWMPRFTVTPSLKRLY